MIKIDTQGYDLEVLKGAEKILASDHPCLVVELIFVDFYKNQAKPFEIFQWLHEHDYTIAGMFNEHYSAEGWLSFADAVFIPKKLTTKFNQPFYCRTINNQLISENTMLRKICEERLDLINFLHENAKKYSKPSNIIHKFKSLFRSTKSIT